MLKQILRYVERHQPAQLIALGLIVFSLVSLALSCHRGPTVLHNPPQTEENQLKIRVAIVRGRVVKIQSASPFRIYDVDGKTPAIEDVPYKISTLSAIMAEPSGMRIGGLQVSMNACRIVPQTPNPITVYEVEERSYYGDLFLYKNHDGTIDVINEVGLEDYLAGVLGREVAASWPIEALKAQAVSSRTRVLYQREVARRSNQRFDVQSDVRDQVYGGVPAGAEAKNLFDAVRATAGQVLTYNGVIFKNYFSSTCGGMTENAARVFKEDPMHYPPGVPCPYCQASPVYTWKHRVSKAEVQKRIQQHTTDKIGDIIAITVTNPDAAGHGEGVVVKHSNGATTFPDANKFRTTVLGRGDVKFWKDGAWHDASERELHREFILSTAFTAKIEGDAIEFSGRGWGHAVGMCQFGAKGMADAGKNYREILLFYHPGTLIEDNYHRKAGNGG